MKELLQQMAEVLREQIEAMGGDPNDLGQVRTYIKGCDFDSKLAQLVVDSDPE